MMLAVLARASLEGAIVAALVWTVVRWLPRLSPATRAALWWCVAAKFLVALVWVTPVELRVLPARAEAPGAVLRLATPATGSIESGTHVPTTGAVDAPVDGTSVNWPAVLLGTLGRRPRLGGGRRSAPAGAYPACHPPFQPGDGADCRDGGRGRRRHWTSPHAYCARVQRDDNAAGHRRVATAHSSARERRHAALRGRRADGALPRAVARQACRSLAGPGAGGGRASLLFSPIRAAGLARVSALPRSGLRRCRSRHPCDDPAGLWPAAPGARCVRSARLSPSPAPHHPVRC